MWTKRGFARALAVTLGALSAIAVAPADASVRIGELRTVVGAATLAAAVIERQPFEATIARKQASGPARLRPFRSEISKLDPKARRRMKGKSWHRGCPVGLGELRKLSVSYVDFHKRARQGKLIVRDRHAGEIVDVFRRLYGQRFRIRRIEPIDRYGGDDHRSMDADNTSAFNCRFVNGTDDWSRHAYGEAIDINPRENPYVTASGFVSPPAGKPYADREDVRKGMVVKGGPVIPAMKRLAGWKWGGNWSGTKDFQHFSADGR